MLDGLDEIDSASDPRRLDQIQTFVKRLRKDYQARVLVTSRPYVYNQKTGAGAQSWRLAGFGAASLVGLEDNTMRALAQALFAAADPTHGQTPAEQFIGELGHVPVGLKTNPLFLTMLAGLWWHRKDQARDGERLPRTEAELYRQSLDGPAPQWPPRRATSGRSRGHYGPHGLAPKRATFREPQVAVSHQPIRAARLLRGGREAISRAAG